MQTAVKVNTDPDNPQEVATMDDSKKKILKDVFWAMNEITYSTVTKTENVVTETDDGNGNIVQTETTVMRIYLYITGRLGSRTKKVLPEYLRTAKM